MRRILSVLLENESGALSRVVGLFSQRGYNIESLTVAPTDDPTLSRMTIQTVGDAKVLEQIEKQLHKLVDVLRIFRVPGFEIGVEQVASGVMTVERPGPFNVVFGAVVGPFQMAIGQVRNLPRNILKRVNILKYRIGCRGCL